MNFESNSENSIIVKEKINIRGTIYRVFLEEQYTEYFQRYYIQSIFRGTIYRVFLEEQYTEYF